MLEIAVITVSDRASRGEYQDRSGPTIKDIIINSSLAAEVTVTVVPDEGQEISRAIEDHTGKDYIITTGGTGISPRDITPEVTRSMCQKELPGISEYLRHQSLQETPFAVFSRGYCGIRENTIIINFPGSHKAVTLCTQLILPLLEHGIKMLQGGKH